MIGAGATSGGAMDASNLLKPALQAGTLRCIGSTTYKEYRQYFEKDRALVRRFQKIDVAEPTVPDAIKILKGLKPYFEEYHKVRYTNDAIKAAVELAAKYINDRKLPDKAIDVIDEVGASQMLLPESRRKKVIGVKEVEEIVAKIARIPPKSVSKTDAEALKTLEDDLKRVVFGQDEAIHALASAIKLARAGLRQAEKPIGCYLFSGPTGVGKTEVAKQLARIMGVELLRFDMSEYMERHTVSRLIGAPPGYVGFDQGGLLTDGVDQHPHCVLLLDEIEKAHLDLFNILSAGDGPRQAHRPQRQEDRFPQRRSDHDHERGRARMPPRNPSASAAASAKARTKRRSSACSRRNSATASTPPSRSRRWARDTIDRVVEKFVLELEAPAHRPRRHLRPDARRPPAGWATRAMTTPSARGRWRA